MGISAHALKLLESYGWPGNLKEFERVILRSAVLSENDDLTARDFVAGLQNEKDLFLTFLKKTNPEDAPSGPKTPPETPLPFLFSSLNWSTGFETHWSPSRHSLSS